MDTGPTYLYHGSGQKIVENLQPTMEKSTLDHTHTRPAVFATERKDVASLFMFPLDTLASIGFENGLAYICIWGTREEFKPHDKGGYLYTLLMDSFEKVGKEYEWQSFEKVKPKKVEYFKSVIDGMIECGACVYFINDEEVFDQIRDNKENRIPILRQLIPENQKSE
ncbi:MAG: hypothetical protein WD898_00515 [Candidatus Paceibacterota bacterium]